MSNDSLGPRRPVDVQFLRTLGGISEIALVIFLEEMSKTEGIDGLRALTEYLEQDGLPPGEALSPGVQFHVKQSGGLETRSHVAPLSEIVLRLIVPVPGRAVDPAGLELVSRLADLQPDTANGRSEFLGELIRVSLRRVHDTAFVQALLDLDRRGAVRWGDLLAEAAAQENAAAASVLVPILHARGLFEITDYVREKRRFAEERSEPRRWANALRVRPWDVLALFEVLARCFGDAEVARVRARVLSHYLRSGIQAREAWNAEIVQSVMGAPASATRRALMAGATGAVLRARVGSKVVGVPWGELYQHALMAHCPEALGLFERQVRDDVGLEFMAAGDDPVAIAVRDTTHVPGTFDASRFKDTLALLVTHGHRLNRTDGGRLPAIVNVALSNDSQELRLRKAESLLMLDCDPQQACALGTAAEQLDAPDRLEWDTMVRAFELGKSEHFWFERTARLATKDSLRRRAESLFRDEVFGWDAEDGHRPVPDGTRTVACVSSQAGAPIVFAQRSRGMADLVASGLVDYVVMDSQTGFTPLGAANMYLARELAIPREQILRLADWVNFSAKTKLVALKTRRPGGRLKGLILVPGVPSASYASDRVPAALYQISRAAIAHAATRWGAHRMGISHLSASQGFHSGIALATAAAAMQDDSTPHSPLRSVTFFSCCIRPRDLAEIAGYDPMGEPGLQAQAVDVITDSRGDMDLVHLEVRA